MVIDPITAIRNCVEDRLLPTRQFSEMAIILIGLFDSLSTHGVRGPGEAIR
jgi:hypothetical protein